jgi:hypothetical protein
MSHLRSERARPPKIDHKWAKIECPVGIHIRGEEATSNTGTGGRLQHAGREALCRPLRRAPCFQASRPAIKSMDRVHTKRHVNTRLARSTIPGGKGSIHE